jgi:hypothetical protein
MPSIGSCEGKEFRAPASFRMVARRLRNSGRLVGKESSGISFSVWSTIFLVQCVVCRVRRWECRSSSCSYRCALSVSTSRGESSSLTSGFYSVLQLTSSSVVSLSPVLCGERRLSLSASAASSGRPTECCVELAMWAYARTLYDVSFRLNLICFASEILRHFLDDSGCPLS